MGTIVIKLRLVGPNRYALFSPNGSQLSVVFYGNKIKAKEWSKQFCSTWYNWNVDYEEIDDEETSGVLEQDI